MKKTIILALLLGSSLAVADETNDASVTLSGLLRFGKPMVDFASYCLDVTTLGGGTQRVCLKGKTLEQFKEQIKKSRYKHVPVRVTGQFKTEFMGDLGWSPQPTMPGWMIWLEVESVTEEILKEPTRGSGVTSQQSTIWTCGHRPFTIHFTDNDDSE